MLLEHLRAVLISTLRYPNPPIVPVSELRRNLKTLFCPRLKAIVRNFGELAPLKLLAGSERRGIVA